ncbi:MAG: GguC protein [Mesorhizobium sp.]|nr:AraD1 family protein [Mesorhizobium sp.]MBL8579092.1 GguC protein [Mesorhizobium sp.]
MRLVQLIDENGERRVAASGSGGATMVRDTRSVLELVQQGFADGIGLTEVVAGRLSDEPVDLGAACREERLLSPIDHPDPAHLIITGTGLTHLGAASARDRMHKTSQENDTDTMRMFRMGVEGGKPAPGQVGVQPEWFWKGSGEILVHPEHDIPYPDFALDAGEEPEIAGIYVIDPAGTPRRLGFALANEFSDHRMEKINYLYLSHSKLRLCAVGPELLVGDLPSAVEGHSRIIRDGSTAWESVFVSGEDNMSHTIANLEYHHFKYAQFRVPGDIHIHMFGTATLSFADGFECRQGDVMEIDAPQFGMPLRNRLLLDRAQQPQVRPA